MEGGEDWDDVVTPIRAGEQASGSVLHNLQTPNRLLVNACIQGIACPYNTYHVWYLLMYAQETILDKIFFLHQLLICCYLTIRNWFYTVLERCPLYVTLAYCNLFVTYRLQCIRSTSGSGLQAFSTIDNRSLQYVEEPPLDWPQEVNGVAVTLSCCYDIYHGYLLTMHIGHWIFEFNFFSRLFSSIILFL